jgi:tartrate dehydratase beta subunit/fumarate hydratase class I family protein
LKNFKPITKYIEFINPLENEDTSMDNIKELYRKGLTPVNITVDDKGNNLRPWSSMGYSSISEQRSQYSTIEK